MSGVVVQADTKEIRDFAKAMAGAPKVTLRELAKAFQKIGKADIDALRSNLPGRLTIRAKGLKNSFKFKATDYAKATDFDKLFVNEYTGWKAAKIFQTGGSIVGKGKTLTVLLPGAIGPSGKRKYTQNQLRSMIQSGKARFIPTPHGTLLVMDKGGLTKTGKQRKGTATILLAILSKKVVEKKRLDFYENFEAHTSLHHDLLEVAIENALVEITSGKGGK